MTLTTITLKRKLQTALALILDARSLVPDWPQDLAEEADRITMDYENHRSLNRPRPVDCALPAVRRVRGRS